MYKFYDNQNKCWISWVPPHEKLAEDIVLEVTGKVGTKDDPVEVTEEVADKISKLYEERAPKEEPKPVEPKPSEIETLKKELENTNATVAELMLLIPTVAAPGMEGGDK
ncbi:hypothetical protein [Aedoeadaptatus coxii]|uniref:hypothetical protein n=1 Tax=Aedoeadaptatus coxii TaxID=755172 RepID=UPI002AD4D46A|nr:hypothetical protein [Peptoniphilus coxii]